MPVRPRRRTINGKIVTTFIADYIDQFGNRHRPSFSTEREAKAFLLKQEAKVADGSFRPQAMKATVRDAATAYLLQVEERRLAGDLDEMTANNYRQDIRRYILGEIDLGSQRFPAKKGKFFPAAPAKLKLADVDEEIVGSFRLALLREGLSPLTARNLLTRLSMVYQFAIQKRLTSSNPVLGARRKRVRHLRGKEVQIPEKDTINLLLANADPVAHVIISFAAFTGIRTSEQRELRWKDIDLVRGKVESAQFLSRRGSLKN